jgi:hypothetical protein
LFSSVDVSCSTRMISVISAQILVMMKFLFSCASARPATTKFVCSY